MLNVIGCVMLYVLLFDVFVCDVRVCVRFSVTYYVESCGVRLFVFMC